MIVQGGARWELGEQLGAGGFGRVLRARGEDGTDAAAKLVPKEPGAERELLFFDLGAARNIVPVIDTGEVDDAWVLIMPLADRSLAAEIRAEGALAVEAAITILRDIATALADIDGTVVHRDLKPDNVLLLNGTWCLADFGISRYAEASTAPDTRKFAMSKEYAAPERWRFERATIAADVYALGVIAFELLTGHLPFPGPSWEDYRDQHLHDSPPTPPGAPPRLAALIGECLNKAPGARPRPERFLSRLARAGAEPRLPAAAQLAAAYQAEAQRSEEVGREASRAQSLHERRAALVEAGRTALRAISDELIAVVEEEAPGASLGRGPDGGWGVQLGNARLLLSAPTDVGDRGWGSVNPPPFDVLCHSSISIAIPADRTGYLGRGHSLYYCDARDEGEFAWFETAYMFHPMNAMQSRQDPFALEPSHAAARALQPGIFEHQVAWPFTRLVEGELDDFVDRWLGWFAAAAQGSLTRPATMPERTIEINWRRR